MITLEIPQRGTLMLAHAVFDVNGTLALDGQLIPGVQERLRTLAPHLTFHVLTAGTHGNLAALSEELQLPFKLVESGEEKAAYVERLGASSVVAFGNGNNDAAMLHCATLGIAILGGEGLAGTALQSADVITRDILSALDLLLYPKRLIATLRS